jgi:hypothetical protein
MLGLLCADTMILSMRSGEVESIVPLAIRRRLSHSTGPRSDLVAAAQ